MQLVNEFVVPRGIDETWAVLTDVERIAPAMPGAQLTEITPDGQYHGTVKIKVGPVTAKYGGVATFKELDEANHHMVLDATGKESSGRGRAAALITADLVPEGADTRVRVTTDLTISGPLAQFGRGAIAEVSARLLNQFVDQLKETVLADGAGSGQVEAATDAPAEDAPASTPAATAAATPPAATTPPAAATTPATTTPPAAPIAAPAGGRLPGVVGMPAGTEPDATAMMPSVPGRPAATPRPAAAPAEVNLLKVAAWPILKRLLPVVIVVAVVIVLLVWWLG